MLTGSRPICNGQVLCSLANSAPCRAPSRWRPRCARKPCFQILDGTKNASTTTLKNQRFNVEDTILSGKENVRIGK